MGSDKANLFGLHDLFGNVSEWANDNLGLMETGGFADGSGAVRIGFYVTALGGGFQSTRKPDDGSEWMLPQQHVEVGHQVDVGFRVARVVTRDVEVLAGYWPPVESLIATATRATISMNVDRKKAADSKTPPDDSANERPVPRPLVALRGLVPIGSFPIAPNVVDFEVQRATQPTSAPFTGNTVLGAEDAWSKVDLANTRAVLERATLIDPDPIPALLLNPVFSMPLPLGAAPWPQDLVTHPDLPLMPPNSKYEVQQQLFRFFDFEVVPQNRYAYRVRLKFTPVGKQEKPTEIFTPWSNDSNWVTVEELRDEQKR